MDAASTRARTWRIAVGATIVIASVAIMAWIWRNGGALTPLTPPDAQAAIEECDRILSGSSAMTARLAPRIVSDFLSANGYQTAPAERLADGAQRVTGLREGRRCTVVIRTSETTQGFRDLAAGEADLALAQRPILPADVTLLRDAGAGDFDADRALAEHLVAFDALAIATHASNPVRTITLDQARDLALGLTPSWRALGGVDAAVRLFGVRDGTGADDFPNDMVTGETAGWDELEDKAEVMETESALAAALADAPTGIGFFSSAFLPGDGVRPLHISAGAAAAYGPNADDARAQRYPIVRRLFVYVRPEAMRNDPFIQGLVRYFQSPAAFDAIDGEGFVALRDGAPLTNAARMAEIGCMYGAPESAVLTELLRDAVRTDHHFHFVPNTNRLDDAANATLAAVAADLQTRQRGGERIILVGHADTEGSQDGNRALALRRASAVRAALESIGVQGVQIESAGEICSESDNETEAGRRENRRVDVWARPRAA
ncbi:MAG: OmpA family protein [Alphaproteobacteria bacterium]|nr:OmpA family protein [Alphaproteobacteria bacterium]